MSVTVKASGKVKKTLSRIMIHSSLRVAC